MSWLLEIRPIALFSLYLALMFLLSTGLRLRQYGAVLSLVSRLRSQWPRLTELVLANRHIFVTWVVLRPLVLLLLLFAANTAASHFIWPQAQQFRLADLLAFWPALPVVVLTGLAMVAFDAVGTFQVGAFDEQETARYFDQAEYWLRGWQAPVVRVLSLGFVNPRQIVAREVRTALEAATGWLGQTLWWVTVQTSLRIAFALSLWTAYALHGHGAPGGETALAPRPETLEARPAEGENHHAVANRLPAALCVGGQAMMGRGRSRSSTSSRRGLRANVRRRSAS